jgi:tetratricopeptide (TPR) repeat protein
LRLRHWWETSVRLACCGLIALLLASSWPSPARADAAADCRQEEASRKIAGCTAVIEAGGAPDLTVAVARRYRGFGHQLNGDFDRAIADYTESIKLDPKQARTFSNRGWAYIEKRQYDPAITDLDEAVRLDPKLAAARSNRGWALVAKRDYDRALADLNEAIRLDPKFVPAINLRGWARYEKRDYEGAIADLNEAIRLNPKYAPAYNNRGNTYRDKGDLARALADYNEAIRLSQRSALAYNNRGYVLAKKGDREKAVADFTKAIALDANAMRPYINRADAYRELGNATAAAADYRKVLQLPAEDAGDRQRQEAARERLARLAEPKAPAKSLRRVALVIGNSAYKNVGALANPSNDARAVAAKLRQLAFSDVAELHDLDLASMTRALRDFGDRAAAAEWAVVFFAGHGIEMGGTNYLIPVDAELKRDTHVPDEAVSLDRVQAKVLAASKFGLVILDACRNNPFAARMVRSAGMRSVSRGLAAVEPEGNVLVAFAAKQGTEAEDGSTGHSPFTEALLASIGEPGLEVNILFRKVRDAVRTKTQRRQDPFVYGSLGSELLYFKPSPSR